MAWIVLVLSGAFEAVWAVALGKSEGFSRLGPTIVFFAALAVSMGGLGWALRTLPVGTAYAVWVGIGASTAVIWSMTTGAEPATLAKVLCLGMIIGGVIGLKVVS